MGLEFEKIHLGRWMVLGTWLEFNKWLLTDLHLWWVFSLTFYRKGARDSQLPYGTWFVPSLFSSSRFLLLLGS